MSPESLKDKVEERKGIEVLAGVTQVAPQTKALKEIEVAYSAPKVVEISVLVKGN